MNVADSERIAGDYQSRGYREAKSLEQADEIVINTCSVRQSAEDRVVGLLYNLSLKLKSRAKRPKIILTGCMLHYGNDRLRQMLPTIDEILPINKIGSDKLKLRQSPPPGQATPHRLIQSCSMPDPSAGRHAWIPISTGCNSFCTFCIVPLSRGREKSRPQAEILREVRDLIDRGYESITLLGQNVNSYGLEKIGISLRKHLDNNREIPAPQTQYRAFSGKPPFVKLLEALRQFKALKKISFMTSNPWDFYPELIDCLAQNPKIDRLIHLPVQSGDNEILRRMNRGYTREQYLTLINKIREKIPEAEFGTDIIVGFPGETEEQFQNTVDLCRRVGFKVAYIAKYSPRPGTVSAKLYKDDVPYPEKKRRWEILDKLINKK